jgi:hypothetical protein
MLLESSQRSAARFRGYGLQELLFQAAADRLKKQGRVIRVPFLSAGSAPPARHVPHRRGSSPLFRPHTTARAKRIQGLTRFLGFVVSTLCGSSMITIGFATYMYKRNVDSFSQNCKNILTMYHFL